MIIRPNGTPIAQSVSNNARAWFASEPETVKKKVVPILQHWKCPEVGCDGYMIFTGGVWQTNNPGYHHDCNKCGAAWALQEAPFPRLIWDEVKEDAEL